MFYIHKYVSMYYTYNLCTIYLSLYETLTGASLLLYTMYKILLSLNDLYTPISYIMLSK